MIPDAMQLDWSLFAVALGGALVTWLTRIGGPWLITRVRLGPAASAALEATPGAVLVALVAPSALSRPSDALAAAFVCLIARRVPMVVAVAGGVAMVVLLRWLL
ncbi:AzlD family protein [Azospirillum picis]|uniref:Membrane protein n=1 Tax=Azospirillum picis TaxID=488438 RepID=A0ABU0MDZ3_9PROT|nr:AzlD domain-containing protein [Azospirillum picis]MBP2297819.1 putative membrane protein [Azospirillum picis]MDQ0531657.1 putative membrane protein [Azospirillum picis]